jgi:hypothetical protein
MTPVLRKAMEIVLRADDLEDELKDQGEMKVVEGSGVHE